MCINDRVALVSTTAIDDEDFEADVFESQRVLF